MIIAVGFKVNNERAVQFRKWANGVVKDYTIKGSHGFVYKRVIGRALCAREAQFFRNMYFSPKGRKLDWQKEYTNCKFAIDYGKKHIIIRMGNLKRVIEIKKTTEGEFICHQNQSSKKKKS